jgi:signal transduction histidine kinase
VAELRRIDQQRLEELDAFAGRVAHDMRDALGVVLLRASMVERCETVDACRNEVGRIVETSRRMGETVAALLDFARAGGRADSDARCQADDVVQQVVADATPFAVQSGAEIVVEPMPPALVACDGAVLSVVMSNLVRNAVKYVDLGSGGARRITVRTHGVDGHLCFEVEDTGPGLPPGAEAQVFQPLVRLHKAAGKPGIGLGLATVKRLVEAHGGEVGVESRTGCGARFWFTLPRPS